MKRRAIQMINEVFLTGQVVKAEVKSDGKAMDLVVNVKEYFGYSGDSGKGHKVQSHNVFLVGNTETVKEFIRKSGEAQKPTYISVFGTLSERSMPPIEGSGEAYGPHQTFVVCRDVLSLSNEVETEKARAYFQGEVVYRTQKHTKTGSPYVFIIAKNRTEIVDKKSGEIKSTKNTGCGVKIYAREESELPFGKGDMVLFAGNLESYELRDYPGVFNSGMKSFDWMGAGFTEMNSDPISPDIIEAADNLETGVVETEPGSTNEYVPPDTVEDEELPF